MTYKEKCTFDNKTWYQLEWNNIVFREFDDAIKDCENIEELKDKVIKSFPNSNLKVNEINKFQRHKKNNRR